MTADAEAAVRAADGDLRRRSPSTPTTRSAGSWRPAREDRRSSTTRCSSTSSATTASAPKERHEGHVQRDDATSTAIAGDADQMIGHIDNLGRSDDVPALRHRLGRGRATRRSNGPSRSPSTSAARRNPLVHALAQGNQGQGRSSQPVPPRRRRRRRPCSEAAEIPAAEDGQRRPAAADGGRRRCSTPTADAKAKPTAARRSTSRCSATAASITTAGSPARAHSDPVAAGGRCRRSKDDVWELYNVDEDFSEADNLATQNPEKLKELQALFLKEAERNYVLPIDDRRSERFNPTIAGRPDLMNGRKSLDGLSRHDRHDGERLHQRERRPPHRHRRGRTHRRYDRRR